MLNWFDITVFIALGVALVSGLRQGLVMQLAGLASIVIAAIFGGKIASHIFPALVDWFNMPANIAGVLSYVVAFLLIIVCLSFVGKLIHQLLVAVQLSFINRMLGGLIAMGTTMVVLSLLLNMTLALDPNEKVVSKKIKSESFFYERVQVVLPAFVPYLKRDTWENYLPNELENKKKQNDSIKTPVVTI